MTDAAKTPANINKKRVACSIVCLLGSVVPMILVCNDVFYLDVPTKSWNIYRLWWCFSCVLFGFGVLAFEYRRVQKSPFPEYIVRYLCQLCAMSTILYGGLHIFPSTSGYLFYSLSFGLGFTLGFMADYYWRFVKGVIDKSNN